jgi:hypothetical protein
VLQECSELRVGLTKPEHVADTLKELLEEATMYQQVEELRTKLLSESAERSSPRLFSALLEGTYWKHLCHTIDYTDSCSHAMERYLSVTTQLVSVVVHSLATGLPLYIEFTSKITGTDEGADPDEEDHNCLYVSRTLPLLL